MASPPLNKSRKKGAAVVKQQSSDADSSTKDNAVKHIYGLEEAKGVLSSLASPAERKQARVEALAAYNNMEPSSVEISMVETAATKTATSGTAETDGYGGYGEDGEDGEQGEEVEDAEDQTGDASRVEVRVSPAMRVLQMMTPSRKNQSPSKAAANNNQNQRAFFPDE